MTNDVEVTKINAALGIVTYNGGQTIDTELLALSVDFLKRQFAEPKPTKTAGALETNTDDAIKRCQKIRPGRTARLSDALQCTRPAGHEEPCVFAASPPLGLRHETSEGQ